MSVINWLFSAASEETPEAQAKEAVRILNAVTRRCFPDHAWAVFGNTGILGLKGINLRLVAAREAHGQEVEVSRFSEIPKAAYQPFHDEMVNAGFSDIYKPARARKTGMILGSFAAQGFAHVRPMVLELDMPFLRANKRGLMRAAKRVGVLHRMNVLRQAEYAGAQEAPKAGAAPQ